MTPVLSPPVSRGLALALLVALLLLVFTLVVQPLLGAYRGAVDSAQEMRAAIEHFHTAGHSPAELEAEVAQLKARERSATGFLHGTNESLAAAELQNRLKNIVEGVHGELRSTQILPVRDEGKVQRISIRGQITVGVAGLQRAFYQLESESPLLFLDNVEIRPQPTGVSQNMPIGSSLEVRFDLYGYMRHPS